MRHCEDRDAGGRNTAHAVPGLGFIQPIEPSGKRITSTGDLAINGAPPAFAEPLHVGRPNIAGRARFLEMVDDFREPFESA